MRRAVGQQYLQDNLVEYNPKKIFSIDPARFTVLEELSDWQSFRRAIYGQKKDCMDVIIHYLNNPEEESNLFHLGFAPGQVEGSFTDKDLTYFKGIPKRLNALGFENNEGIYKCFKEKYSKIAEKMGESFEKEFRVDSQLTTMPRVENDSGAYSISIQESHNTKQVDTTSKKEELPHSSFESNMKIVTCCAAFGITIGLAIAHPYVAVGATLLFLLLALMV